MLKAALVPQQLTLLLQETACQVDGISPPLLPVTQSRGGYRQMLHLCVCFTVLPTVQSEHERSDTRCIVSHQLLPLLSLTTLSGDRSAGKCLSHIIQVVPPLVVTEMSHLIDCIITLSIHYLTYFTPTGVVGFCC